MLDLAELLRVNIRTVKRYYKEGKLPPAIRLGRLVRWRREEIEQWLQALRGNVEPARQR
jgi:excisionase family DNA binding protein